MKTPKARHVYRSTSPLLKARVVAYQWSFLSESRARIEDLQSVALVRNALSHVGESFPFPGSPAGSDSPLRDEEGGCRRGHLYIRRLAHRQGVVVARRSSKTD